MAAAELPGAEKSLPRRPSPQRQPESDALAAEALSPPGQPRREAGAGPGIGPPEADGEALSRGGRRMGRDRAADEGAGRPMQARRLAVRGCRAPSTCPRQAAPGGRTRRRPPANVCCRRARRAGRTGLANVGDWRGRGGPAEALRARNVEWHAHIASQGSLERHEKGRGNHHLAMRRSPPRLPTLARRHSLPAGSTGDSPARCADESAGRLAWEPRLARCSSAES